MARMPASTPTATVRADDWLPGESVTIRTFQGDGLRGDIQDALIEVNRRDDGTSTIQYTPGRARKLKLKAHLVGWTLFEETEPGVAGKPIAFTPENIDNLDPDYAQWIDAEITKHVTAWRVKATGGTTEAEQATFQQAPL